MPGWDGNGNFARAHDWTDDEAASIDMLASRFDTEDDTFAAGINACLTKNGENAATGNLPMGGYRHTGVGNSTARNHYAATGQVQDGSFIWCGTAGGTKNALTLSPTPAITAYAAGQDFLFLAGGTSSDDAVTIAISGLATKAGQINGQACSTSLIIEAGKLHAIKYDGTQFQITRLSEQITVFARTLLDDTSASAARATLGAGDASGPASSTDHVWPRFDGTGGKTLQNGTWAEDDSGNVTGGGTLNMGDRNLSRADLIDTSYEVNALGDLGGGTDGINYTAGHVVTATISTGAQTLTFSNFPAGYGALILFLTNGGSQTITWPGTVSAAPTNLTAAGVDKLLIESPDGGTTHYVTVLGRDI